MQEILALILEQVRNVWRFRWWALAIAWAIAVVGWLYVYSLPNQYQSQARVHIDTTSAIHPLLSGMAVTPNVNQQVNLLIQTVLSRPNLRDIARQTGLDLNASSPEQEQALLDGLNSRVSLRSAGSKSDLYRVSYTSENPATAQAVVQEVINIMTKMALGNKSQGDSSEQATTFLAREVDKYKKRLTDTEHELAVFKKSHAELMPGSNDYVARVQGANASISQMQDQISAARNEKASLQRQLNGGGGNGSPADSQQIRTIDQRIAQTQNNKQQFLNRYTPQHPDVLAAKADIARLQKERSQTMARLSANPSEIQPVTGPDGKSGIRSQIDSANVRIKSLQSSIQRQKSGLGALKEGADEMTGAQAQLAELSRNYHVTQDQYQKLLTRLYSARLSTDVQQSNDSLKFRVVDPPEKPAGPSGPPRVILMTMALLGAIGAGLAFAFFLSQIRPVFINRRSLTDSTGLPVLGSVTMAWSAGQRAKRQAGLLMFLAGAGTLIVGYVAAVLFVPIGIELVPSFITGLPL